MAALEGNGEERTESPSQFRREEFRKNGSVAMSRELLSVAVLLSAGVTLYLVGSIYQKEFASMAQQFFVIKRDALLDKHNLMDIRFDIIKSWGWMVLPVFAMVTVTGLLACVAQVGFHVSWEPLGMDWNRLNPKNGFQRMFSMKGVVEAIKALLKFFLICFVVYLFLKKQAAGAGNLLSLDVRESMTVILSNTANLFLTLLGVLFFMSALDFGFQKYQLEKQMMMTKTEAKEEFKLREGDPLIKSRVKQIQRRMARRRMMEDVPKADVIVTNPTHLAIAIKYDVKNMAAPRVVAKGAGVIAEKIRELARFNQIPVVENKPLARTMFKTIEIGEYIPRELYKAVAEVLAYVYRLKGRVMNG